MPDFKIKAVISAVDKITGPIRRIAGNIKSKLGPAFAFGGRMAGGLARGMGKLLMLPTNTVLFRVAKSALDLATSFGAAGHELHTFSIRTGLSVGAIQELRYAAKKTGVDAKVFNKALGMMAVQVGQAHLKSGKLYGTLKKGSPALLKQVQGAKSTDEAFGMVIEAMSQLENASDRATLAQAAFGRTGIQLAQMSKGGIKALIKMREERRKGYMISEEEAEKATELHLANMKLKDGFKQLRLVIGAQLAPVITPLLQKMASWVSVNRNMIALKIVETVKSMGRAFKAVNWESVWQGIDKAFTIATQVTAWGLDFMGDLLRGDGQAMLDDFGVAWEGIKPILTKVWGWIKTGFEQLIDWMILKIQQIPVRFLDKMFGTKSWDEQAAELKDRDRSAEDAAQAAKDEEFTRKNAGRWAAEDGNAAWLALNLSKITKPTEIKVEVVAPPGADVKVTTPTPGAKVKSTSNVGQRGMATAGGSP